MATSPSGPEPALEPEELFPRLESLVAPPIERWIDADRKGRPGFRGWFAGRRATFRLTPFIIDFVDDGTNTIDAELEGKTYGVRCHVAPPALVGSRTSLGDPEFDVQHEVVGAPRAVLHALFDADLRARLVRYPTCLRFEGDVLAFSIPSTHLTLDAVASRLDIASTILDELPRAITAGGAGEYLELGTLAAHPEVAAAARGDRSRRLIVLAGLALVCGACLVGLAAAAVFAW